MAGGVTRPAIFLPLAANTWSPEHRDLVLAHELAHLAGRDPLRHLVTRLAVACYWFHPLAWIAAREASVAREEACDEAVLALGARPSAYARVLLDLAESAASPRLHGALPMVHRSRLEKRLMAILTVNPRPAARRLIAVPAVSVALLTLSVAAATPAVDEPQGAVAGVPAGMAAGVAAGVPAGVPEGLVAGVPEGRIAGVPAGLVGGIPAGRAGSAARSLEAVPIGALQATDTECWSDARRGNFSGHTNNTRVGGRDVIINQVGWRDGDRVIRQTLGDLRLCMVAEGLGDRDGRDTDRPSQWLSRSRRVVMETQRDGNVQRLEISGGLETWQVNGSTRDFNAAAQTWRDRMLAIMDTTWEVSTLQGEVSSLQGQISSIHGQRSSLQGEISSLQGQVSAMQGRISAAQGEESSLRGQISSIQGHVSSLQGAISAQQGAISSLTSLRYGADADERRRIASRIAEHDDQIARLEREIRDYDADRRIADVQRQIDAFNADAKTSAIEADIGNFNLRGKVAALERRIVDLDVEGNVRRIERQIEALDADRRVRRLEDRRDQELSQLRSAIAAIR
jgi:predicted  nucleic acid-binding Zn-ribbon protein